MAHTINTLPYWVQVYERRGIPVPADIKARAEWHLANSWYSRDDLPDVPEAMGYNRGSGWGNFRVRQLNRRNRHNARRLIRAGRWDDIQDCQRHAALWEFH